MISRGNERKQIDKYNILNFKASDSDMKSDE